MRRPLAALVFTLAVLLFALPLHAQRRRAASPTADAVAPPAADVVAPSQTPAPTPPPPTDGEGAPLDDVAARQHFESGRAYFQRAQYEQAASEFAEAYRLSERPALLINWSRAEEGAGRLEPAIDALRRWQSTTPADDPERPAMVERMTRLESALARSRAAASAPPATPQPVAPPSESGLTKTQVIGIVVASGGAALGVGALITGLLTGSAHANLEDTCDASGACPASSVDDIDRGESLALVSTVLTGAALAAGATGLVLLLLGGPSESERPAAGTARLTSGPGELGAGVAWSF